jgi:hypothetical protein
MQRYMLGSRRVCLHCRIDQRDRDGVCSGSVQLGRYKLVYTVSLWTLWYSVGDGQLIMQWCMLGSRRVRLHCRIDQRDRDGMWDGSVQLGRNKLVHGMQCWTVR